MNINKKLREAVKLISEAQLLVSEVARLLGGSDDLLPEVSFDNAVKKTRKPKQYYRATQEFKDMILAIPVGGNTTITKKEYGGEHIGQAIWQLGAKCTPVRKYSYVTVHGGYIVKRTK